MLESIFGVATHGVRWAFSTIPGAKTEGDALWVGARRLRFTAPEHAAGGGFEIQVAPSELVISAATPVEAIGALHECARQVAAGGLRNFRQVLQFKTRFYKMEGGFGMAPESLHAFFQQVVARHFNALVLFVGYHPFEMFLDYEGLPWGTYRDAGARRAAFELLERFVKIARQYGMGTFIQHYVGHFSQRCADQANLGLKESGTRLCNYDHPLIDQYLEYVYRRTFETLPDLEGLFFNFESSGDSMPILEKTLLPVLKRLPHKPNLQFRTWGLSNIDQMADFIKRLPCPTGLINKSHERNDVYYYPVCDERVKLWKEALPETEFTFQIGPCHNCATNIGDKIWTDPDYIWRLMENMVDKGTDSISFQSSHDLIVPLMGFPSVSVPAKMIGHARANQGHMEAVVDFVRGHRASPEEWAQRYAKWYNTDTRGGKAVQRAILESSQIVLKHYWQFLHGSAQEGHLYPARDSFYQEPFFYPPMSLWGVIGVRHFAMQWSRRPNVNRPARVLPTDTQAIIDFVNPAVRKRPKNHPLALAGQIRKHAAATRAALAAYRKTAGEKADQALVSGIEMNILYGERSVREIQTGIELYSCYFATSRRDFFNHLRRARNIMLDSVKVLGDRLNETNQLLCTSIRGTYQPARDAEALERILRWEHLGDFPFPALAAYLHSHERYNEIRRLCRPGTPIAGETLKRNRRLLKAALSLAERAVKLLDAPALALYRDNAMAWVEYLRAENDWLTPPAMACLPDAETGRQAGFRALVHDQCYRWGEHCWIAFEAFFQRYNFFRDEDCDCRVTRTADGLKVSLREHGIDWKEREAVWDKNRGGINQTGFMQIFLRTGRSGVADDFHYTVFFRGEGVVRTHRAVGADGVAYQTEPTPILDCVSHFEHTDSNWRFDFEIPWAQLGGAPKPGAVWGFNLLSNPAVLRNHRVVFSQGYEIKGFNRLGSLVFPGPQK